MSNRNSKSTMNKLEKVEKVARDPLVGLTAYVLSLCFFRWAFDKYLHNTDLATVTAFIFVSFNRKLEGIMYRLGDK